MQCIQCTALAGTGLIAQVACDFKKVVAMIDEAKCPVSEVLKLYFSGTVVARVGKDAPPPPIAHFPYATVNLYGEIIAFYLCCPTELNARAPAWLVAVHWASRHGVTMTTVVSGRGVGRVGEIFPGG